MNLTERQWIDTQLVEIWDLLPEDMEELGAGSPEFWRYIGETIEHFRKEHPDYAEYIAQKFDEALGSYGLQRPDPSLS